ncbi:MAG: FAD:protein FMN transferase [Thermoanaerobacteraceae bacterium]|nr:FAD:protein FMN transferase [Thermoanaerobacteraceae bacterium]
MRQKNTVLLVLLLLIMALVVQGCTGAAKEEPVTKNGFMLDTNIEVTAYGEKTKAEKAVDDALACIRDIDNKMSPELPSSYVVKINEAAGKDYVKVDDETFYVIKEGIKYGDLTGGMFDITVGPLVRLWGIGTDHARVPAREEIDEVLRLIDYRRVNINESNKEVKLPQAGMRMDLGGIAKGYAADAVKEILNKDDIKSALINLGGNIYAVGSKPDGSEWRIGIQDPFNSRGDYIGIVRVKDKSVVTSGNYERYFEANGKRYHHIFDLSTGYPSENGIVSTTIISDRSIDGDALSTSVFVLGVDKGLKLVEPLDGVEAVIITSDKKVYTTSGAKSILEITNKEYTYENR